MELDKVRKLSSADMNKEIAKTEGNIVQLSSEVAMHKLKNYRKLRTAKKYLARLLTVQKEKSIVEQLNPSTEVKDQKSNK